MSTKYTSTPWKVLRLRDGISTISGDSVGMQVGVCDVIGDDDEGVANANLIVCAVNSYEMLVNLARQIAENSTDPIAKTKAKIAIGKVQ